MLEIPALPWSREAGVFAGFFGDVRTVTERLVPALWAAPRAISRRPGSGAPWAAFPAARPGRSARAPCRPRPALRRERPGRRNISAAFEGRGLPAAVWGAPHFPQFLPGSEPRPPQMQLQRRKSESAGRRPVWAWGRGAEVPSRA